MVAGSMSRSRPYPGSRTIGAFAVAEEIAERDWAGHRTSLIRIERTDAARKYTESAATISRQTALRRSRSARLWHFCGGAQVAHQHGTSAIAPPLTR